MSTKAIDPVCGMEVNTAEAKYKTEYMGKTFYFCAEGCLREFERNPHKYMGGGH